MPQGLARQCGSGYNGALSIMARWLAPAGVSHTAGQDRRGSPRLSRRTGCSRRLAAVPRRENRRPRAANGCRPSPPRRSAGFDLDQSLRRLARPGDGRLCRLDRGRADARGGHSPPHVSHRLSLWALPVHDAGAGVAGWAACGGPYRRVGPLAGVRPARPGGWQNALGISRGKELRFPRGPDARIQPGDPLGGHEPRRPGDRLEHGADRRLRLGSKRRDWPGRLRPERGGHRLRRSNRAALGPLGGTRRRLHSPRDWCRVRLAPRFVTYGLCRSAGAPRGKPTRLSRSHEFLPESRKLI